MPTTRTVLFCLFIPSRICKYYTIVPTRYYSTPQYHAKISILFRVYPWDFFPKTSSSGRDNKDVARNRTIPPPTRNRTNAKIKLSANTAQYRNQIFTLLRVFPLKFLKPPRPAQPLRRQPLFPVRKATA